MHLNCYDQSPRSRTSAALTRWLFLALVLWAGCLLPARAQTLFLNFNATGQYTNNFNNWNDNGGVNGGVYCYTESPTAGIGNAGRGFRLPQSAPPPPLTAR